MPLRVGQPVARERHPHRPDPTAVYEHWGDHDPAPAGPSRHRRRYGLACVIDDHDSPTRIGGHDQRGLKVRPRPSARLAIGVACRRGNIGDRIGLLLAGQMVDVPVGGQQDENGEQDDGADGHPNEGQRQPGGQRAEQASPGSHHWLRVAGQAEPIPGAENGLHDHGGPGIALIFRRRFFTCESMVLWWPRTRNPAPG